VGVYQNGGVMCQEAERHVISHFLFIVSNDGTEWNEVHLLSQCSMKHTLEIVSICMFLSQLPGAH
jgi:hypothetical protein